MYLPDPVNAVGPGKRVSTSQPVIGRIRVGERTDRRASGGADTEVCLSYSGLGEEQGREGGGGAKGELYEAVGVSACRSA